MRIDQPPAGNPPTDQPEMQAFMNIMGTNPQPAMNDPRKMMLIKMMQEQARYDRVMGRPTPGEAEGGRLPGAL